MPYDIFYYAPDGKLLPGFDRCTENLSRAEEVGKKPPVWRGGWRDWEYAMAVNLHNTNERRYLRAGREWTEPRYTPPDWWPGQPGYEAEQRQKWLQGRTKYLYGDVSDIEGR